MAVIPKELARYSSRPTQIVPGNLVTLLPDSKAALTAMLDGIRTARSVINLASYRFASDQTGLRFAEALIERATHGVEVNVIYDAIGSIETSEEFLTRMRDAGVRLLEYGPLYPWRPNWSWFQRDHRKLLALDGRIGFVGGMNLSDEGAPKEWGGRGWKDLQARVEGPVVRDLVRSFIGVWLRAGGAPLEKRKHFVSIDRVGPHLARLVGSQRAWLRRSIRRSLLHAFHRARKSIYIANSYFVPDLGIRRRLKRAAQRGVDVRVLVPGNNDMPTVKRVSRVLYPELQAAGVKIYEWPAEMLHAKIACVDQTWSHVGSFNLDRWSAVDNLEIAINILDEQVGAQLHQLMQADVDHADFIAPIAPPGFFGQIRDRLLLTLAPWL